MVRGLSVSLLLDFLGLCLLQLGDLSLTLIRHNTTAPVLSDLIESVVVVSLDRFCDLGKGATVLRVHISQADGGASLTATDCAKASLALDDAVRDTHTSAKSGQVENKLDGIDIVSYDYQLSLLGLDQRSDSVGSLTKCQYPLGWRISLTLGLFSSSGPQTILPRFPRLRSVLVEKLEELSSVLLIQSLGELVDWRGNLDAGVENGPLSLDTNVFGPTHKSAQITSRLNILTDGKVLGSLFEERIVLLLGGCLLGRKRSWGHLLLALGRLMRRHDDKY